jgi:hypothetical protein
MKVENQIVGAQAGDVAIRVEVVQGIIEVIREKYSFNFALG